MKHHHVQSRPLKRFAGAAVLAVALLLQLPVQADPFYLRYDADEVFPEQASWQRFKQEATGEQRWIENGWLNLDTRGSYRTCDYYYIQSQFSLSPGEELHVAWRMQTVETQEEMWLSDVSMFITNAQNAYAQLNLARDYVSDWGMGLDDPEHLFNLWPNVPHDYEFVSSDGEHYTLYVDGQFAFSGEFVFSGGPGPMGVSWGDSWSGMTSLSKWDYVEVKVTPEPGGALLVGFVALALAKQVARRGLRTPF